MPGHLRVGDAEAVGRRGDRAERLAAEAEPRLVVLVAGRALAERLLELGDELRVLGALLDRE